MHLQNNTILITGGGSGIGLALARKLSLHNKVIICGRDQDKLKQVKAELPDIDIVPCDISNPESVRQLIHTISTNNPALNFLINNAGIMRFWNFSGENFKMDDLQPEIQINLIGSIYLTQSLLPQLQSQRTACMLNVSSALAYVPMSAAPIYSATKAALHSYSISLRQQLGNTRVKVFELLPAAIETQMAIDMEKKFGIENSGPKMSPEKLAKLIIKGVQNDTAEIRPGMANVLYHMNRFFPSLAQRMIRNQAKKILRKL